MRPWQRGLNAAFGHAGPARPAAGPGRQTPQIAKDVMVELDLKKLTAPDFTASIRPGMPALVVLNEDAVPEHLLAARRATAQAPGPGQRPQRRRRDRRRHPL